MTSVPFPETPRPPKGYFASRREAVKPRAWEAEEAQEQKMFTGEALTPHEQAKIIAWDNQERLRVLMANRMKYTPEVPVEDFLKKESPLEETFQKESLLEKTFQKDSEAAKPWESLRKHITNNMPRNPMDEGDVLVIHPLVEGLATPPLRKEEETIPFIPTGRSQEAEALKEVEGRVTNLLKRWEGRRTLVATPATLHEEVRREVMDEVLEDLQDLLDFLGQQEDDLLPPF